jgi:hypothetical protein
MSVDDPSTRVEYRQIARFPGYRFGDDGSVWTCWKITAYRGLGVGRRGTRGVLSDDWRRMSPGCSSGYWSILLKCGELGKFKASSVHSLILEAFRGPCPPGMECRHLDGNRKNARLDNLEWATPQVNNADKKRHGTALVGERHSMAKLNWVSVGEIRRLWSEGDTLQALAVRFGVTDSNIRCIVKGKTWRA